MPQTALVQAGPVCAVTAVLAAELSPWASRATTVYRKSVSTASPVSVNEVLGGSVAVPAVEPTVAQDRVAGDRDVVAGGRPGGGQGGTADRGDQLTVVVDVVERDADVVPGTRTRPA